MQGEHTRPAGHRPPTRGRLRGFRDGLHPATQIVLLLGGLVLVYGISSPVAPLCVLAASGAGALVTDHVSFRTWLTAFALLAGPTLVMIAIIQGLFYPGSDITVLWQAGPTAVTVEGLLVAGQLWLRIAAMIALCALFAIGADAARMFDGLLTLRAPVAIAYICAAAMSLIPLQREQTRAALRARTARGWDTSRLLTRVRLLPRIVLGLFTASLVELDQRHDALTQRGFRSGGRAVAIQDHPDDGAQRVLRWAAPVLVVVLVAASLGGFLPLPSAARIVAGIGPGS